jgi:hypothetical protein
MSSPPRTPNRPRIAIRFRAMHHHDSRTSARRRHARTRALARPHKSSIRSSHVAPAILPRVHAESITNRNTLRLGLGEHGERAVRSVLAPKGATVSSVRRRPEIRAFRARAVRGGWNHDIIRVGGRGVAQTERER